MALQPDHPSVLNCPHHWSRWRRPLLLFLTTTSPWKGSSSVRELR